MSEKQETVQSFAKDQKKISFFAAILIVMGGSIGAGIFFKAEGVTGSSQGNMILSIFCWIIASIAVIAMALALIEVASVRNDNLSLIGWNKVFNSRVIYKASKNFMVYVYLPLTYFFMPLYVILSLQDALDGLIGKNTFGGNQDWIYWTIICLAMSAYFITVPALWSKVGDYQNKVITYIKFVPIAGVIIFGLAIMFAGKSDAKTATWIGVDSSLKGFTETIKVGKGLASVKGLGGGLGMFLAISAIFFAYDGFYVASGIQSEMKEPKKTPIALFLGLGITTVIYLLIAISMSLAGGSVLGIQDYLAKLFGWNGEDATKGQASYLAAKYIIGSFNLMIAIGVMGILNGFSMWAPRYVEDLLKEGELPLWKLSKGKLNDNFPIVGVIYACTLTFPIVILFTLIGALGYQATNYDWTGSVYMARLYCFADLMANWTAMFTFMFLAAAIFGAILNRKKHFVEIAAENKKKYFLPMAWIAVVIVTAAMAITTLVPVIDMFLLAAIDKDAMYLAYLAENASPELTQKQLFVQEVISRVSLIVVLFIFIGLSFLPTIFEDMYGKKKFGSVKAWEEWKLEQIAA